jgi:hypothetical protein
MAKFKPSRAFAPTRPALSLFSAPERIFPPSERVVAAVLQFGDLWEERQDGLVGVRFTEERLGRQDMTLLLGEELGRARDVTILWDESECEMVRVLDLAPLRAGRAQIERVNTYAAARQRSAGFLPPATQAFAA